MSDDLMKVLISQVRLVVDERRRKAKELPNDPLHQQAAEKLERFCKEIEELEPMIKEEIGDFDAPFREADQIVRRGILDNVDKRLGTIGFYDDDPDDKPLETGRDLVKWYRRLLWDELGEP